MDVKSEQYKENPRLRKMNSDIALLTVNDEVDYQFDN